MRALVPMVIFVLSCGGAGRAVAPGAGTGEAAPWARLREHIDQFEDRKSVV